MSRAPVPAAELQVGRRAVAMTDRGPVEGEILSVDRAKRTIVLHVEGIPENVSNMAGSELWASVGFRFHDIVKVELPPPKAEGTLPSELGHVSISVVPIDDALVAKVAERCGVSVARVREYLADKDEQDTALLKAFLFFGVSPIDKGYE